LIILACKFGKDVTARMVFEKGLEREYGILADPHFARKLIAREKSKENCPAVAELPKDIKNQLRGVIFNYDEKKAKEKAAKKSPFDCAE
jgi:hypothetical protein